jgi:hypothetical protein
MSTTFTLKFDTDNAAFDPDNEGEFADAGRLEIVSTLRKVADRIERNDDISHAWPDALSGGGKHLNVIDVNGNVIGTFVWREEP